MSDERNSSESERIDEALQIIINKYCGEYQLLNDEMSINHELPIDGDDASDFLNDIHARFETKFKNFRFQKFFHEETSVLYYHWAKKLFGYKYKTVSFTYRHLKNVIRVGEWFDPP